MEISTIKKSLKKFGLNFNNKIVKAIEDIHKGTDWGTASDITEITENNLEEVIAVTDSVVIKFGLDGKKVDTIDFTDLSSSPEIWLCLCYAKIKNNLIELPVNYLNKFIENYIPIDVFSLIYSTSEQIPGAPEGFNLFPITNITSNTFNIDGITFTYSNTMSSFGTLTNLNGNLILITSFDMRTLFLSASEDYTNGFKARMSN